MAKNAIDRSLAAKYKKNGGGFKGRLRTLRNGVNSAADKVNKITGGENLSKYFGQKLAKMRAAPETKKYVSESVSGKDALKSAGNVGLSAATVTGLGGLAAAAAKGATKVKGVSSAIKEMAKKAGKSGGSRSKSLRRILQKKRAGGDSKMLKSLKRDSPQRTKRLKVKSNGGTSKSFNRGDIGENGEFSKLLMMPSKRAARTKLTANKIMRNKKGITKNERGEALTRLRKDYPKAYRNLKKK